MKDKKQFRKCRGFSLAEVMAVLIILGLLGALVASNVGGAIEKAKVNQTRANLTMLHTAVKSFYMDNGRYPSEDIGLEELIDQPSDIETWPEGGYIEQTEIPFDGWGNEFIYERYTESGKPFHIKSLGRDGEEGGEGYDLDLFSTDAR